MQANVIVIDDFLDNPDDVREYALSMEYNESGNYPGDRTVPVECDDMIRVIGDILRPHAGEITEVLGKQFQKCYGPQKSWVHVDLRNTWAGVLFLTPNPPPTGGTGMFRHRATGISVQTEDNIDECVEIAKVGSDYTQWEMTDQVANKYNRLVLFRGNNFHSSMEYFGRDDETCRLFQTFFITTER